MVMVVMVTRLRTLITGLKVKCRTFYMLGKCTTLSYIPSPLSLTSYIKFGTTKKLLKKTLTVCFWCSWTGACLDSRLFARRLFAGFYTLQAVLAVWLETECL